MLIICPDCETSYEVEPADLGPSGRKVRCTSCGSVWHAVPPGGEELAEPDADDGQHIAEPMFGPEDMAQAETADFEPAEADLAAEEGEIEDIEPSPEPAPRRRARGTSPLPPVSGNRSLALASALGVAVIVLSIAWRDDVVSYVPDLAGLYNLAGLPVNLRGLEFRDMETVETTDDGIPQLIVRGTIENVTQDKVAVPRLRLAVRGISGREIFVWTAVPAKTALDVGESLPFLAQLASPPAEGREIAVRFVGAREAAPTVAVQ
jgi:predicted Zn finger-like uncharacterized protein